MKKLIFAALVAFFGASTAMVAADNLKAGAMGQGSDIAGQVMDGKSAKEIADGKKEEAKDLKPELVEQLHNELRGYYYINSEIEKANKRLYAKGFKLIELASL